MAGERLRLFWRREADLQAEARFAFHTTPTELLDSRERLFQRMDQWERASLVRTLIGPGELPAAAARVDGVQFDWSGPRHLWPWMPHAYFDRMVASLNGSMQARELVGRVKRFLGAVSEREEPPFAFVVPLASADPRVKLLVSEFLATAITKTLFASERLETALLNRSIRGAVAEAIVKLTLDRERERFAAEMTFRPRRPRHPLFTEIAFWGLWDWTCLLLFSTGEEQGEDELAVLVNSLDDLCDLYGEQLPEQSKVGEAPFEILGEWDAVL